MLAVKKIVYWEGGGGADMMFPREHFMVDTKQYESFVSARSNFVFIVYVFERERKI